MSVQKALVVELFAILLVLFGGFTGLETDVMGETWALYGGFYLGLLGLVYGLVGTEVIGAIRNDT
jgi:drug/metabolite transporter superfamily protein YnfA